MKVLRAAASSAALIATLAQGATGTNPQEQDKMNPTAEIAQVSPEPLGRWPAGPCSSWRYGEFLTTPAKFNADLERSHRMMRRLIVCVFDRFAPGNAQTALYVAERESGLLPWAVNVSSNCLGLYQHIGSAWPSRAASYLRRAWFRRWPARWSDPRANAIVSARMVAAGGWGPWSL